MMSSWVGRVAKYLVTCRDNNPNNWKGLSITWLARFYNTHRYGEKTSKILQILDSLTLPRQIKAIQRISNNEVEKHLTLGVEYARLAVPQADIAEFGTMTGRTARIIAKSMAAVVDSRPWKLHLFDSFEGLPTFTSPIDRNNPFALSGGWRPGLLKGVNPTELMRVCSRYLPKERIVIHEGWFCDTLPKLPDSTKFSMLHVDSDLYQSAIDVLDVCFSRGFVAEGAIIFFDDWNCAAASLELGERRAWSGIVEKYSVRSSDEGPYGWHGHKFIVHSYKGISRLVPDAWHPHDRGENRGCISEAGNQTPSSPDDAGTETGIDG